MRRIKSISARVGPDLFRLQQILSQRAAMPTRLSGFKSTNIPKLGRHDYRTANVIVITDAI